MSETPTVVAALAAVMADVRAVGKGERNTAQNFSFRGVDAVVNAVGPALRAHGVVVVPELEAADYSTVAVGSRGTTMTCVRVRVAYVFHGPAGDHLRAVVAAESFDSGDKATSKAMSVAFRTVLLQALTLPTDDVDPDAATYQRAAPPPRPDYAGALAAADSVEDCQEVWHTARRQGHLDDALRAQITERARHLTPQPADPADEPEGHSAGVTW